MGTRRDRQRIVKAVGVVPKPVQKPHPPLFQPFASSDRSIRWCAEQAVTAILPPLHPTIERQLYDLYAEVSARRSATASACCATSSSRTPTTKLSRYGPTAAYFCGRAWFEPFGFSRGCRIRTPARPPRCAPTASPWSAPSIR